MRNTCLAIVIGTCMLICGCDASLMPLKNKYGNSVIEVATSNPRDTAWSAITTLFERNGLRLKIADRNSGTIQTYRSPQGSIYTYEDKNGQLEHPNAWVVLPKVYNKEKEWKPKDIYGKWNILVIGSGSGLTTVKIEPNVICVYYPNSFTRVEVEGKSTGKLEELLERALKGN